MTRGTEARTSTAPKRVVYTAVVGGYEQLNDQPVAKESGTDFVCFTDDPDLRSDTWQLRVIEPRFPLDPIRSARFLKCRGTELLSDYDESLWIDNSVRLKRDPSRLFDDWLSDADLAVPRHSLRGSVIAEFEAVATLGYDDSARVYEQLIHYTQLNERVLHDVPFWTALIARRHAAPVLDRMELWYDHLLRYSRRDQLSVNFVLADAPFEIRVIEVDNAESDFHEWPVHNNRNWSLTRGSFSRALRIPLAEVGERDNLIRELQERLADERDRAVRIEESYQKSFSWRVTRPVRAVRDFLKR
ncbi:glycosyltransferase domain-containing protein [Salinibacterium soli]|uniref:DUF616 domain-containing protein n=1 Tax=Antiquaquibacter soli TaxID=3064523 RepID=A0ABT9BNX0_9MICO|nr:glycosyltransferase domain-containing protein [Protaetiibacter sp. WY-16]MDO7881125.1 DUF616 domain-containing protein [Protaetiibacter sp. WY-16]